MARFHGPQISKNDLIFYYDAANIRSYPGSGTTWTDISGKINDGALTNGPTYASANNGYIAFDGTDDYVIINSNTNILSTSTYTKTVWFYITDFTAVNNLMSGDNSARHALWLDTSTNLKAGHNGGAEYRSVVSTTTLVVNTWYYGAVSFDTTNGYKLYLNGNLEASNTRTDTFTGGSSLVLLGSFGGTNLLEGRIALAAAYNRVLSGDEIRQNFNALRGRFGI
jgi:hypothetical protein